MILHVWHYFGHFLGHFSRIFLGVLQQLPGDEGISVLHMAAHVGSLPVVRLLLEARANKDRRDNEGTTPLRLAASSGNTEVVQFLLESGVDKETWRR